MRQRTLFVVDGDDDVDTDGVVRPAHRAASRKRLIWLSHLVRLQRLGQSSTSVSVREFPNPRICGENAPQVQEYP